MTRSYLGKERKFLLSKLMLKILLPLFTFICLAAQVGAAEPLTPTDTLKTSLDGIKTFIEQSEDLTEKKVKAELRKQIMPLFDREVMAKSSLGSNWRKLNTPEKKEFIALFSELVFNTYFTKIKKINSTDINFKSEDIRTKKAIVRTEVLHKGEKYRIDYKLHCRKGPWLIYDIVIQNIGLISNYRNEFAGIIRKYKIPGLLSKLKKKLRIG